MNLNLKIESLIANNSSDFEVSKAIKDEIRTYIDTLNSIFEENQGKHFLVKHTKSIDGYIKVIFKYALRKHFGEYQPLVNTLPITIVSLGSYAREQLSVYSDIDLLIVYDKVEGYNLQPIIETILQIAWDSGLKLGHRVHELSDLFPASLKDQTIKTALLESRYLCGSKYLWMHTERELTKIRKDNPKEFIRAKISERHERLKKYPFNMQPNIKSSAGGLRDLNTLFWIANILYNITRVKELTPQIISEHDYSELMHSVEFLYRIRAALHLSAGKKQDQLFLHFVPDVAKKLDLTQRRLVEKTFEAMLKIETSCEYFIQKITHELFDENDKGVYCIDKGYDVISHPFDIKTEPLDHFLDHYLNLEDKKYYFDPSYLHQLQKAKIGKLQAKKIKALFYREHLYSFFIALYKSKQLAVLIPPMKKVLHLPQFDGYHKYPVDLHSIRTLLALEAIEDNNIKKVFDTFTEDEKALLRVVTFLHDCGKGRKKDHSQLGAVLVRSFVQELGFKDEFVNYANILVRYHTLMSNIASREDIYSEKVIFSFISKLKYLKVLELLYVLTYADIESVGKGVYSSFNARVLNELFIIASEAFTNKKQITEAQKRIKKENILKKSIEFNNTSKVLQKKIFAIESNLLFFKYLPEEIVKIASWVYALEKSYDYTISTEGPLVIELIRKEHLNLGFLLGKLSNLNVGSMDIFKIFNNIKYFRVEFLEEVTKEDLVFIQEIIDNSFDMDMTITLPSSQMLESEIDINCNHSNSYAKMSVHTKDNPALLANIMSTFDDIGIDIASAKIQTIKNRARNLFLIEKNGKFCNNQEEVIKRLTTKVKG